MILRANLTSLKLWNHYEHVSCNILQYDAPKQMLHEMLFSVIPIFGVLTHEDKISIDDSDYMRLEQEFREGLGIPEYRFLLCTTYCDAYDKHHGKSRLDQRHPTIDIPILKFMRQVSFFSFLISFKTAVLWKVCIAIYQILG